MIRMEIACMVIISFIAVTYFSAKRKKTFIHTLFSWLIVTSMVNLLFDAITVYTVNHLDTVPELANEIFHKIFIGTLVIVLFITFRYNMTLINKENSRIYGNNRKLSWLWNLPLFVSLSGVIFLPLYYKETTGGNYSYGPAANMAYISVGFYLIISIVICFKNWNFINPKKKSAVIMALGCELIVSVYQALVPLSLFSGVGIALLNLAFFLTVESPDVHLIEQLRDEKERADLANNAKTYFLANMSHEIRTPINSILGMNEMILRESHEELIREYASDIQSATQSLYSIINDILDVSKIESGKMEIIPVEYDVSSLIHDLSNMITPKAEAKNLTFHTVVDPSLPSRLYGDDVRIRQVLVNLLTNAVKYTHKGSIELRVKGIKVGMKEELLFTVKDTGIGIKPEDISRLYVAFQRIEEKKNRNIEGTGLGLSISKQLLEMMGSSLVVQSVYGEGSTFSFRLEQNIVDLEPIGNLQDRIDRKANEYIYRASFCAPHAHILVVDDNEMNRKVFQGLLKQTEVHITEASSGAEALSLVKEQVFDLIFLDHMMPNMDGIETLRRMRELKDNRCSQTPVVVLTANAVTGAKEMYMAEGFDDFLAKPIVPDKLEREIKRFLPPNLVEEKDNRSGEEGLYKDISKKLPDVDGLDWNYGLLHFPDKELLVYLVEEFVSMIDTDVETLQRLFEHLSESDNLHQYHIKVHGMKSSAALIGIIPLSGMAKVLENAAAIGDIDTIYTLTPVLLREWSGYKEKLSNFTEKVENNN